MSLNSGYAGICGVGNRFNQPKPGGRARMGTIHFGEKGFRKRSKTSFHLGMQRVRGSCRKTATAAIKRFGQNVLRNIIGSVSHVIFRVFRFFAFRPDLEWEPVRVHPLRKKAKANPWIGGINDSSFEKTGRSDADALLEMKRNPATSVYEVRRIIAVVG